MKIEEWNTKHNIDDYSWAEVETISKPYDSKPYDIGIEEIKLSLMVHSRKDKMYTILLHREGKYIDLRNKARKFYLDREGEEKSSVINWQHPLKGYLEAAGLDAALEYTPKEVLKIVKQYANFFESYTAKLEAEERANRQEENIRKLQMIPNTTKSNAQKI